MYEAFSQEQARCNAIEFVEEQVDGDAAYLEYAQTDNCGAEPRPAGKQKVQMLREEGEWKIDDVEVVL